MSDGSEFLYVGIDAHQETLSIAVLEEQGTGPEPVVQLPNRLPVIRRWFRKLLQRGSVVATYEAGCLGFVLQRVLDDLGVQCVVAAPSHLPRIPGDQRKTDRIDARRLASFLRAGQIVAVSPPSPELESLRGLTRYRQAMREDVVRMRHRIQKFLLLRGHVHRDGQNWSPSHMRWLRQLQVQIDDDRSTLDSMLDELEHRQTSLALLDQRIEMRGRQQDIEEAVRSLMAFRGVKSLTAVSVIAELGDPRRFRSAKQVSSYCGITPSKHSSGERIKRGPITRAGNARLRRLLVEAVQHYARPYPNNSAVIARRANAPTRVQAIATRAEQRLRRRYRALAVRKHTNVAKTAVARELIGFLWAALLPEKCSTEHP
ncbi:MAG: IS110 family transposase [Planctomycetes bacterium]|nr:IS110 family transposase [Planctomycetota bacterium]